MYIIQTLHKCIKYNLKRLSNVAEMWRKKRILVVTIILDYSIKCFKLLIVGYNLLQIT